ncbi:hypothetical protein ALC60_13031 [Trachymyrmex zeteki]|uniref:Secreted protein n=1 Tax=Mycetomoellerius zeteki TaxID=64791 RepID=A0A151WJR6_9HYME|nr:hypothetical protein ALC60_13031 [Trachymyrmex zeteki]
MWNVVLLFLGLMKAVSYVAGSGTTVDEKSGTDLMFKGPETRVRTQTNRVYGRSGEPEADGKFGHVVRFCKYFRRRFWIRDGVATPDTFTPESFLSSGFRSIRRVSRRMSLSLSLQVFMLSCRCRRWTLSAHLLIYSVLTRLNRLPSWRALKIKNAPELLAKEKAN